MVENGAWHIVDLRRATATPVEGSAPYASGPSWSPNGRLLTFIGAERGVRDYVVVANSRGRIVRRLAPGNLGDMPAWSWDGQWIAYADTVQEPGDSLRFINQIHISRVDGTSRHVVTHRFDAENGQPVWSPDGGAIVYQNGGSLRITSVDGSDDHRLTDPAGGADWCAAFSADGKRIAFLRSAPGGSLSPAYAAVVVMDGDGSNQRAVAVR